jgi:hypothetical protein
MANKKISALTPKGSALSSTDLLEVSVFNGSTYDTKSLTGANILSGTGLTIGTTAIASGTIGRILFEGTGNVLQQDSTLFWDNTNKRLGVGATPDTATRLDIRSQGALSTDLAFRVRNNGNTANLVDSAGNGSFFLRANTGDMHFMFDPANNRIHLKRTGVYTITTDNAVSELALSCNSGSISITGGSKKFHIYNGGNFHLGGTSLLLGSGNGNLIFQNGTAPFTNLLDRHYYYSADVVAGNASPHFRTENGAIIKLYQETTAVTPATVVSGGGGTVKHDDTFDGYTLEKVVRALRNQGLLA